MSGILTIEQLVRKGGILNPEIVWEKIKEKVRLDISEEGYETWFKPTRGIAKRNGILVVEVPNPFFAEWITEYYTPILKKAAEELKLKIAFSCKTSVPKKRRNLVNRASTYPVQPVDTELHPRYVFENFVVGESNRFPHAASLAVAKLPGKAYNPLFIYGGVGLGKTHLLQAIGNYIQKEGKGEQGVYYTSAELFFIELIEAIKGDKRSEFRDKYRSKHVLLIDDIHFLKEKECLQEEIFHTFNFLYKKGRQIVITSDRPPRELPILEERLISRFQGGLIADLKPPDLETRIAILKKKAEEQERELPDDIAYLIATKIKSNIRDLEGCLTKVFALSSFTGRNMDRELVNEALKEFLKPKKQVTSSTIIRETANSFGISPETLKLRKKTRNLVIARQVAMYLLRKYTTESLKEIGNIFEGKDHTTVIHATKKIEKLISQDSELREKIMGIEKRILG